jgi:cytochrome P450
MAYRGPEPERAEGVCPVVSIDYRVQRPAFWHYENLSTIREQAPFVWNTVPQGFWMFSRYDHVREALQRPDVFASDILSPLGDPEARTRLLPQHLNGDEHRTFRHVLNPWFSPGTVQRVEPLARERCRALLDELVPRGRCDLATDFAMIFPTEIFLGMLGLPVEDGDVLLPFVEGMFRGFFGGDPAEMKAVIAAIEAYYDAAIAEREAHPRDATKDFISHLLAADVDGEPLERADVVTLCLTLMAAGLDTTRSALGYIFHHLATHPDHRVLLAAEPQRIPAAVEEFLRLYGLIIQDGRSVTQDLDFHGCPLRKGDIVWLGLAAANRDPREFERPDEFVVGRPQNRHLGFGAGAHRCLGAHLARIELAMVLEEWLPRIPDFWLDTDDGLTERGGQLMLQRVPLAWRVTR